LPLLTAILAVGLVFSLGQLALFQHASVSIHQSEQSHHIDASKLLD
jgi:hypothetical protein